MTDYCGNIVYKDSSLAFILMPEGRILLDSTMQYEYFIKDHLGNVRSIVSESGKVLEENAYYPFGMRINKLSFSNTAPENRYKYNNKELTSDFSLDWYEYGARMYDPQIGRWHVVDPMAEKYYSWSPYNYVANNPMIFIDPNGMASYHYNWDTGEYEDEEGKETDRSVVNDWMQNNNDNLDHDPTKPNSETNPISLTNFVFSFNNLDFAQKDIGFISTANNFLSFNAAIATNYVFKYAQIENGVKVSANKLTAIRQFNAQLTLNNSLNFGNKLGLLSLGITGVKVISTAEFKASDGYNTFATVLAFYPPYGTAISTLWFVTDFTVGQITDRSLSDRIDANSKNFKWNW